MSEFWWVNFRKTKAGIKLHTLFDINTQIHVFIHVTEANKHDVNAMDIINYEPFAYCVFDRAYLDYLRLYPKYTIGCLFCCKGKIKFKIQKDVFKEKKG